MCEKATSLVTEDSNILGVSRLYVGGYNLSNWIILSRILRSKPYKFLRLDPTWTSLLTGARAACSPAAAASNAALKAALASATSGVSSSGAAEAKATTNT